MNPSTLSAMRPKSPTGSYAGGGGGDDDEASPPIHPLPSVRVSSVSSSRSRHPTGQDGTQHSITFDLPVENGARRGLEGGEGSGGGGGGEETPSPPPASSPEERLRRRLAFFFLNPLEKYRARRQMPWKLFLQIVKVFVVTAQLCIFGNYRYAHTKYNTDNQIAFAHLFLKDWDAVREIHAYPPATGAYAIYRKATFFRYFDFIAQQYHNIDELTVNPVFRNGSFNFCQAHFARGQVLPNLTWSSDDGFSSTSWASEACIDIPWEDLGANFSSKPYLAQRNFQVQWDTIQAMHLNFTLQTMTFSQLGPLLGPECFIFDVGIHFDNADYDGQIPVSLGLTPRRYRCPNPDGLVANSTTITVHALNYFVIGCCLASLALCIRALVRAQVLRLQAQAIFRANYGWELTQSEKLQFLNGW